MLHLISMANRCLSEATTDLNSGQNLPAVFYPTNGYQGNLLKKANLFKTVLRNLLLTKSKKSFLIDLFLILSKKFGKPGLNTWSSLTPNDHIRVLATKRQRR